MAGKDRLTGLLSRSDFDSRFREELARSIEKDSALALGLIDLDRFMALNDKHGHKRGDLVLKRIATILKKTAPAGTLLARVGGEEFALLFPGTERELAFLNLEQIRSSTETPESYPLDGSRREIKITVSGGVAAYPTDGVTATEVMRKADQALYRAKNTGRNKICIAQEERMATKTTHYTLTQLERLARLSKEESVGEASLLREALDDLLNKYRVSRVES